MLAKDEHAIHELDVLVDLAGEHDDGHAGADQVGEERVEIALGTQIDPAGGVVEQQHARVGRQHREMMTFCWLPPERVSIV